MGILSRKSKDEPEESVKIDTGQQQVFPEWSIGASAKPKPKPEPMPTPKPMPSYQSQDEFGFSVEYDPLHPDSDLPKAAPVKAAILEPPVQHHRPQPSNPVPSNPIPTKPVVTKPVVSKPVASAKPIPSKIIPEVVKKPEPEAPISLIFEPAKEQINTTGMKGFGSIIKPQPVKVTKAEPIAASAVFFVEPGSGFGQMSSGIDEDANDSDSVLGSADSTSYYNYEDSNEQYSLLGDGGSHSMQYTNEDNMGEFLSADSAVLGDDPTSSIEVESTIRSQGKAAVTSSESSFLASEEAIAKEEERLRELLDQLNRMSEMVKKTSHISDTKITNTASNETYNVELNHVAEPKEEVITDIEVAKEYPEVNSVEPAFTEPTVEPTVMPVFDDIAVPITEPITEVKAEPITEVNVEPITEVNVEPITETAIESNATINFETDFEPNLDFTSVNLSVETEAVPAPTPKKPENNQIKTEAVKPKAGEAAKLIATPIHKKPVEEVKPSVSNLNAESTLDLEPVISSVNYSEEMDDGLLGSSSTLNLEEDSQVLSFDFGDNLGPIPGEFQDDPMMLGDDSVGISIVTSDDIENADVSEPKENESKAKKINGLRFVPVQHANKVSQNNDHTSSIRPTVMPNTDTPASSSQKPAAPVLEAVPVTRAAKEAQGNSSSGTAKRTYHRVVPK